MKKNIVIILSLFLLSCSEDDGNSGSKSNDADIDNGTNSGTNNGGQDAEYDTVNGINNGGGDENAGENDTLYPDICESVSSNTSVDTVHLAFAFDVSGSMGKGDYAWHDVTLKWDPVKASTDAFFQDSASSDLWASMTFFPADDDKCSDESYVEPDVHFTMLPSPVFGQAMDAIREEDWRGRTPTLHVMRGMLQFVEQSQSANPGKYVIVLVTDGFPQGCDDAANDIEAVAAVAAEGLSAGVSTFVIGVNNPPIDGAPDTTSNLGQIAEAGGTSGAFFIDTGNPEQTSKTFSDVINEIRSKSIVCTVSIPAPPDGREFDKQSVNVTYTSGSTVNNLPYDPSCTVNLSWHYDDPLAPSKIVLCPNTCQSIQDDSDAVLSVEFACYQTIPVV